MANGSKKRTALVTGGSRGLGRDIALTLAANGIDVILTYHSRADEADLVAGQIRAMGRTAAILPLDIGDIASLGHFVSQVERIARSDFDTDRIDVLVNNAGIGRTIPIAQLTEGDFDLLINVHFKGVVFLTQKMLERMNDRGSVVFITAAADRFSVNGYATYAAAKGAIEVFSRYVAKEYGARGIRSNTVAPGGIVTDFNNAAIRGNPHIQEFIIAQTPMGRLGEAHDIGGVVGMLCSDDARWMTGQRLEVSGGFNI